jgi:hypothetical protein
MLADRRATFSSRYISTTGMCLTFKTFQTLEAISQNYVFDTYALLELRGRYALAHAVEAEYVIGKRVLAA